MSGLAQGIIGCCVHAHNPVRMAAERMNASLSAFLDKMSSVAGHATKSAAGNGSLEGQQAADASDNEEVDGVEKEREHRGPGLGIPEDRGAERRGRNRLGEPYIVPALTAKSGAHCLPLKWSIGV